MMKILAVNGSPRGGKGNTDRILQPFLKGAASAGARCETVYAADLDVKECTGCFSCWAKTPGKCVHNDDMAGLLPKIVEADMIVWATPLYYFGMNVRLRRIIERMLPLNQPYMVKKDGRYRHPERYEKRCSRQVLISNCGFPERGQFEALVHTFNKIAGAKGLDGSILCPAGELLGIKELQGTFDWYLDAAREAGREMAEEGRISAATAAILERPLAPVELFVNMTNAQWRMKLGKSSTLEQVLDEPENGFPVEQDQGEGEELSPPAGRGTFRDLLAGMALSFQPEAGGGLQAVYQFDVAGDEPGQYYLQIGRGKCTAVRGRHPRPDITIHTPSQVWLAISRGEMAGPDAMMSGKYTVEGDFSLLMQMPGLFSGHKDDGAAKGKKRKNRRFILRQVFNRHFIVSAVIPLLIYFLAVRWGTILNGIIASGCWSTGVIAWGLIKDRKTNILASMGAIMSVIGLLGTVVSSDPVFYLASPIVQDVLYALLFLGSLGLKRPLVQMIVEDGWSFPAAVKESPRYDRPWRILTTWWGFLNIIQAAARTILMLTVSTGVYYAVSTVFTGTSNILLMAFSIWFPGWYWRTRKGKKPHQPFNLPDYAIKA